MRLRALLVVCAIVAAPGEVAAVEADERPWTVTATVLGYFVPEAPDFAMVLVPLEIRRFHVEARYNYEALDSGSAFAGVNGHWGERVKLHLTPMIGGVFGALDGVVPALRLTVTWWKLDLYSESEIVVDIDESHESFFYNWSELGISPLAWLRGGIAIQRTHVVETPLAVQRGLFVGVTLGFATVSLYEFNAFWTTPTWVAAISATF
jgi:hypothetical protein